MSHTRSRRTHNDAMTLWRARDVYRVQRAVLGILVLVFGLEWLMLATHGAWLMGCVVISVQGAVLWGFWWLVQWGARWVNRGLWWGLDHARHAVQAWWCAHRR